ncbi:hybrid sensor histidine kinase/response regulator [Rhodoferax sp.]|uniref:ATP-binding response regulator n=1 Tax=Rhodoferax sp. TaxID=50421 RepID=UPI0026005D11|nr:hybrid sensor histidine kinase/response regulator [Rhodoferax sp.]
MSRGDTGALDPEKLQLLRHFGSAVALSSLLYAGFNWLMGFVPGVWIMLGNGAALMANQFWLGRIRNLADYNRLGMAQTAICFTAVSGVTYYSGGVQSPVVVWIALAPIAATLLFGFTSKTVFWLAMTLTAVAGFGLLPLVHLEAPRRYDTELTHLFFANSLFGFVLLLFVLTQIFESIKNRALQESETRNRELRVANDRVEAAYVAKSRFLAAASHDLRQPAHALGMFVARLSQIHQERDTAVPERRASEELVQGVTTSAQALQELLDVLFDYSRLESTHADNPLRPVCVNDLFTQLRVLFANTAASKGLHLRIRPTPLWVMSDPVLLQRVLLNLVSNALEYTPRGTVLVTCRPAAQGQQASIQVWDSGIGIARELHNTVFEEFFQVENPERDRAKGLGLGLSMVDRSCRLLGHALALRSNLGCGSRFTVTATATPLRPRPSELPPAEDFSGKADVQGASIWLIEDNALGGQALQGLLLSWGCKAELFEDADQAQRAAQEGAVPDFIISDYRLRHKQNGIGAILTLRAMLQSDIPACLITGDLEDDVNYQAHRAGLVLLKKPLQPAKLRSLLRRSLKTATS